MDQPIPRPAAPPEGALSKGGRRALTKARNRQIILDAARLVFAEIGFGAATVRDIIRATPLASGTFYNYFKSKEEIYQALRDDVALAIRPGLREARAKAATAEEFLSGTFRVFFDFVARERLAAGDTHPASETVYVRMDTPEVTAGFAELREDLEAAIARGLFPRVDADFLMAAIVGTGFEIAGRMMARTPADVEAAAGFATSLFLGGVSALPKKEPEKAPGA